MKRAEQSNYPPPPQRSAAHERLGAFVGRWHAGGQSYGRDQDPGDPKGNAEPWVSDEITAWHPGGFFLIQDETARTGDAPFMTHAVIGYDEAADCYVAHAFENHGHYRRYEVRVDGRVWTFDSGTERARIEFSEDGNRQDVCWEWRPVGDVWQPLCDRVNVRVGTDQPEKAAER